MGNILRAAFAAVAILATSVSASRADAAITTTLTFEAFAPIRSGLVAYRDADLQGGGSENSFSVPAGVGSTSLFPRDKPLGQIVVLGVSDGIAAQAARALATAAPHLIVGLSESYAGQDFTSAFGDFDETRIVDALETLTMGFDINDPRVEEAYGIVDAFTGILLTRDLGFGPNAAFQLTSFSIGTPFGTGQSLSSGSAVPEPATWALLIGGFGIAGGVVRRRRAPALRAALA